MERFPKEKTEIKKPPTYFFYLIGIILLFVLGFVIYYFGYYEYLENQLGNLTNINQNLNLTNAPENTNQNKAASSQKIYIDWPKEDEVVNNPATVQGTAAVFDAPLNIRIKDANGKILGETTAMTKEGQTLSPYEVRLNYATSTTEFGLIEAFDYSAKDGSIQDLVSVKVKFGNFNQTNNTVEKVFGFIKAVYNKD